MAEYYHRGTGRGNDEYGGLYKRMGPGPIMNFVKVGDIDTILARVGKLGGKILMPKSEIKTVGTVTVIQDTEENIMGLGRRSRLDEEAANLTHPSGSVRPLP